MSRNSFLPKCMTWWMRTTVPFLHTSTRKTNPTWTGLCHVTACTNDHKNRSWEYVYNCNIFLNRSFTWALWSWWWSMFWPWRSWSGRWPERAETECCSSSSVRWSPAEGPGWGSASEVLQQHDSSPIPPTPRPRFSPRNWSRPGTCWLWSPPPAVRGPVERSRWRFSSGEIFIEKHSV